MADERKETDFVAGWTKRLLEGIGEHQESGGRIFKRCADYHYEVNQMDRIIRDYVGDLDGFMAYLCREWGWKAEYSEDRSRLIIDENKDYCVCPVAAAMAGQVPENLCECSRNFAENMFSRVLQRDVRAKIVRSYIRDGKSCIYEIEL